jgi:hypothetical protein
VRNGRELGTLDRGLTLRYPHEREGLEHVRDQLPDASPYHGWSYFEFVAFDGSPYAVDLLVLGPAGFHLLKLKAWSGKITGDELEWQEHDPGPRERSPATTRCG